MMMKKAIQRDVRYNAEKTIQHIIKQTLVSEDMVRQAFLDIEAYCKLHCVGMSLFVEQLIHLVQSGVEFRVAISSIKTVLSIRNSL